VEKLTIVIDAGTLIHPDSAAAQAEGVVLWGLSTALYEGTEFVKGQPKDTKLDSYRVLRMGQIRNSKSLFPVQKCQLDWASPRLPQLPRRLGTRSLPLRVCVFEICQFVPKPCGKLSRIRLDLWD